MNLVYTAKYKLNATDRFHGELPNKRIFGYCDGLMMLARACRNERELGKIEWER